MLRGDSGTDQKSASAKAGCAVGVSSTVSASTRLGQSVDVRSKSGIPPRRIAVEALLQGAGIRTPVGLR